MHSAREAHLHNNVKFSIVFTFDGLQHFLIKELPAFCFLQLDSHTCCWVCTHTGVLPLYMHAFTRDHYHMSFTDVK